MEDVADPELDQRLTAKVLQQARSQQEEVDREENQAAAGLSGDLLLAEASGRVAAALHLDESDEEELGGWSDADEIDYQQEAEEISEEEARKYEAFMSAGGGAKQRTLADMILDKIGEQQREAGLPSVVDEDDDGGAPPGIDPQVANVYRSVGILMSRYTAGKVPKAFKVIPRLRNWEEVLFLTDPERWSPHAVFVGVRIFVSNMSPAMAQRFLNLVLLPRFRDDIREHHRLHFALFQAMKKACFKPGAFYKGVLLPLCQAGNCTLREAVIMSSVLSRVSIPVEHSAAALLRMADMAYTGTTSFFMRVLLDKKYALPYRVIDALVDHYTSFGREERELPVVWHHSLLCFVQRYKHEIREEDKDLLKKLLKHQTHHGVTPEIHRELDHSRKRGEKAAQAGSGKGTRIGANVSEDTRKLPPVLIMDIDS